MKATCLVSALKAVAILVARYIFGHISHFMIDCKLLWLLLSLFTVQ